MHDEGQNTAQRATHASAQRPHPRRGALIVFEGAEGVGKSTQVRRLIDALDRVGLDPVHLREPGGTLLGESVRSLLLDNEHAPSDTAEALLFLSARAQVVSERILPALEEGKVVVLDRFFLSTYAYQVSGRGLDEEQIRQANQLAVRGLVPDLTIVLHLLETDGMARAQARGAYDRIEAAGGDFHARVREAFDSFLRPEWQAAHPETGPVVGVSAEGSEDDVFVRITDVLATRIPWMFGTIFPTAGGV